MFCRFNIESKMRNSYDIFEIDNYIILSTLQNFQRSFIREYSIFVYQFGLKLA